VLPSLNLGRLIKVARHFAVFHSDSIYIEETLRADTQQDCNEEFSMGRMMSILFIKGYVTELFCESKAARWLVGTICSLSIVAVLLGTPWFINSHMMNRDQGDQFLETIGVGIFVFVTTSIAIRTILYLFSCKFSDLREAAEIRRHRGDREIRVRELKRVA
jgi:hypothetical protein